MDLTLFLCCTILISKAYASPMLTSASLSPKSINQTDLERSWVANPSGRGTLDVIFSCITTLFLCAYTAFHPNTPPFGGPSLRALLARLKFMGYTIVFPEYVLYHALRQLLAARALRKAVNESHNNERFEAVAKEAHEMSQDTTRTTSGKRWRTRIGKLVPWSTKWDLAANWTLEQAFFAACGGVAVDSSGFWQDGRLQFTCTGISTLAEWGLLPEIPVEEVQARSNADLLSKVFTFLQALWFVIQSCARLRSELPLTLVETHILIHVGCTLLTYLVWLKKPYAISAPLLCQDRRIQDMAALFVLHYHPSLHVGARPDIGTLTSCDASLNYIEDESVRLINKAAVRSTVLAAHVQAANRAIDYIRLRPIEFKWDKSASGTIHFASDKRLVAREIPNMDELRVDNTSNKRERKPDREVLNFIALQALSAVYGLCYLAVWRSRFPSDVEMWLWRASCLSQFAFFLAGLFWRLVRHLVHKTQQSRFKERIYRTHTEGDLSRVFGLIQALVQRILPRQSVTEGGFIWFIQASAASLVVLASASMVLARLYLFTESWISLRSPPQGTYATVHWTAYIPHIS